MSPRSLRRAAEHKARKLAAQQQRLQTTPSLDCKPEASELLPSAVPSGSTGPRTPEGKAISSMNALRTGLTGRTVLLPTDDADAYVSHIENYSAEYSPIGYRELELVQSLADTSWRLRRIPGLEMSIYAKGRREFAESFNEHDPSLRPGLIELEIHVKYEKVLRNLQLQESRLTRRYANEAKELRELQKSRAEQARPLAATVTRPSISSHPSEFEFSTAPLAATVPAPIVAASRDSQYPSEFEFSTAPSLLNSH